MSERPNEREGGKKGEEMRGLAESCFSPHPILRAQGPTAKHYHWDGNRGGEYPSSKTSTRISIRPDVSGFILAASWRAALPPSSETSCAVCGQPLRESCPVRKCCWSHLSQTASSLSDAVYLRSGPPFGSGAPDDHQCSGTGDCGCLGSYLRFGFVWRKLSFTVSLSGSVHLYIFLFLFSLSLTFSFSLVLSLCPCFSLLSHLGFFRLSMLLFLTVHLPSSTAPWWPMFSGLCVKWGAGNRGLLVILYWAQRLVLPDQALQH